MKRQLLILITVIGLTLLSSCNSSPDRKIASEEAAVDTDTIAPPASDVPAAETEHPEINPSPIAVDSIVKVTHNIKYMSYLKKTEGTLVYYCPARMVENTDNNVSVTITKAALKQAIDELEKRVAATTGKPSELIHDNITGSSITIASKMKVELKYADKDFQTIYKPEYDDQIFDGENDMHWDWIIKPTKVGNLQLSIILSAFDEKNDRWIAVQTPPKIFDIKVQVDPRGYFSKLWGFFGDHPEWLLTQLLFPLAAFFYGKRQKAKTV